MKTIKTIPLIALHGAWGDRSQWDRSLGRLSLNRTVVAQDLLGHGTRARDLSGISIQDYIDDVTKQLKETGPSILMGHSLGGLVACCVADLNPTLVKGLVLLASTPVHGVKVPFHPRLLKPSYIWAMATGRQFRLTAADRDFVRGNTECALSWESGKVVREVVRGKFGIRNGLQCSTFFALGLEDPVLPPQTERRVAQHISATTVQEVHAQHMLHMDSKADALFKKIQQWIEKTS